MSRPVTHRLLQASLVFAVLAIGCGSSQHGGGGESGTTATTGEVPDHNIVPDPEPCAVPMCDDGFTEEPARNCCQIGVQPSAMLEADDAGCPGAYPNNWTCDEEDRCVHGGCTNDADCGHPDLKCKNPTDVAGNTRYCVTTCAVDPEDSCDYIGTGMKCTGSLADDTDGEDAYCKEWSEGLDESG